MAPSASSIAVTLHQSARRRASHLATISYYEKGKSKAFTTYGELEYEAALVADQLRRRFPTLAKKQERLVLLSGNHEVSLFYIYAAVMLGLVLVPLNTRWSRAELQKAVEDCGATVAVCESSLVGMLEDAKGLSAIIVLFSDLHSPLPPPRCPGVVLVRHEDLVMQAHPPCCPDSTGMLGIEESGSDDVHCLIYTSGSTGQPKGVMLTHGNQICQACEKCRVVGYSDSTVYLSLAPLFHIGGLSSTLAVTLAGGTHVFLPRMDMDLAASAMATCRVNTLVVVPAILHGLLTCSAIRKDRRPLSGVSVVLVGGQSMPSQLQALASAMLPDARFIQTYACSEACSSISFLDLGMGRHLLDNGLAPACVGLPASVAEVRIMDEEGGVVEEAGRVGEIVTRGPHVMRGYWGKPRLTTSVLRGGWLHTGDLGWVDERGRLHFAGRKADVIRSGGESIFAIEVERAVEAHPQVAQVAVVGIPDDRLGEKAVAAVVLQNRPASSAEQETVVEQLRSHCRQHLSRYKVPREFVVLDSLPRNATGKVVKAQLKQELQGRRSFL